MKRLKFTLAVWVGMMLHGLKNSPQSVVSKKSALVDVCGFFIPWMIGSLALILAICIRSQTLTLIAYGLILVSLLFALNLMLRKQGSSRRLFSDMLDSRDAQVARMYPSQHAKLARLYKNMNT